MLLHLYFANPVDDDVVVKALRSFPHGSGGGPTGLRPQHLRGAMVACLSDELIRQLASVINILAHARAPAQLQPYLGGANDCIAEKRGWSWSSHVR